MTADRPDPYVGLRPYGAADRDRFFGRTNEIEDIRDLWLSNRLLVVYGASGVGKTSLLNAGVLPALTERGAKYRSDVLPIGWIPQPNAALRPDVTDPNPYVFGLLSSWAPQRSPADLADETVSAFLARQPESTDEDGYPLPLLVAIDQFEQVFADEHPRAEHLKGFLDQLAAATSQVRRLRLLISIRAEYFAHLLRYEAMIGLHHRARFEVFPLGRHAALEAVTRPLRGTPRAFAPGVAERLVDDLRTVTTTSSLGETAAVLGETIEPIHLQVACSGLWNSLPPAVTLITAEHLRDYGNVDDLLLEFCSTAVADVAEEFNLPLSTLWTWLARTFVTDRGARGTVYEGIAQTGDLPNGVARMLEARRILKSEDRLGSRWYELPHDRLIGAVREGARPWWSPTETRVDRSADGYLRQAQAALTEGRQTLAEDYAVEAIRLSGQSAPTVRGEAVSFLARSQARSGQFEEATEGYREAIDVYLQLGNEPAVGRLRAELGRLLRSSGNQIGAMDELTLAVRLLPGDLAVKVDLARVLRDLDQEQGAIAMLGAALTVAPDFVDALVERGLIHARRGSIREARADLRNAIRLQPEVAERDDVRDALAGIDGGSSA